jgi:peptidoglycan/xylan/chitin deacetylase (PgdA/CDA1 family)
MYDEAKGGLKNKVKTAFKRLSVGASATLSLQWLIQKSQQKIFLPFYHTVRDEACPYIDPLYRIRSIKQFKEDLDLLLQYFEPISLDQLIKIKKGEIPAPQKAVMHLSFDDGLKECAEIIAPILIEKSIPATFFINSAFVDNKALMFRYKTALIATHLAQLEASEALQLLSKFNLSQTSAVLKLGHADQDQMDQLALQMGLDFAAVLQAHQPYMSQKQLSDLLKQGFTLGSHSIDHPLYKKISLSEQVRQTLESQKALESNFDLSYRVFAFPFTDDGVSKAFFDQIFTQEGFDLSFGGAGVKLDAVAQNLQRFPMESQQLKSAKQMLKTEYFYFLLKGMLGKNRIERD